MAWYYENYSCGHEGRINIIGPTKDRQWKADRHFDNNLCEECKKEKIKQENENSKQKSLELELPELEGTEKQVDWANTIRLEILDKIKDSDVYDFIAMNETKASFWIDNRNIDIEKYYKDNLDKKVKQLEDKEKIEEINAEATVYPLNQIHPGVVEIYPYKNEIEIQYTKNEKFKKIVKSFGYRWDYSWTKKTNGYTGPSEERAAEIGHKLLSEGFAIRIIDKKILSNAINGNYKPEITRWIKKDTENGCFAISWSGRNDKLYRTAKSINSAKYSNGKILIKADYYNEIEDFANLCGFSFSEEALELLNYMKNLNKNIVNTEYIEKNENKSLEYILKTSNEVIIDLKEDEDERLYNELTD